ncbi:bifunctional Peptidase C1A [Babesia duncani]|nr:bifunctional Peptidase C1A [Babesia duncani]
MKRTKAKGLMNVRSLIVSYEDEQYTRRILTPSWVTLLDKGECYRAMSITDNDDDTTFCIHECIKHKHKCPNHEFVTLGECLHRVVKTDKFSSSTWSESSMSKVPLHFIQESYSNRNDIEKDDESDKSKRHHEEGREIRHQQSPLVMFANWMLQLYNYSFNIQDADESKVDIDKRLPTRTNDDRVNDGGSNNATTTKLTCKDIYIKCALSGLQRDMWKRCINCGQERFTDGECFFKTSFLETLGVEDVPTRDGLTPIPVKPKVGPDELIDAFEYTAAHDRRQDKYCNEDNCIRLDDPKSCISNLPAQDQKKCGTCWIFANTLHLEILICMEDVESKFVRTFSEMYMASCAGLIGKDACNGGNEFDFSKMLDHIKYWPSKHDLKYEIPLEKGCPKWQEEWINELPELRMLPPGPNSINSFPGYILLETKEFYPDRMEELINLVKNMIREKGSVLVSMHGYSELRKFDKQVGVISICQNNTRGEHLMVIIGYGTYQKRLPGRRGYAKGRYWQIRNSYGDYWGNNGNFKLDMDGPKGCNGRVFYYIACLNVIIKKQKGWPKPGFVPPPIDKAIAQGKMNVRDLEITLEGQVYTRRVITPSWVNIKERGECYRAMSITDNDDDTTFCIHECVKYINKCPNHEFVTLGECLHRVVKTDKCMFCGV